MADKMRMSGNGAARIGSVLVMLLLSHLSGSPVRAQDAGPEKPAKCCAVRSFAAPVSGFARPGEVFGRIMIGPAPSRRTVTVPDEWFAEDKSQHFLLSFASVGFVFAGARYVGLPRRPAMAVAVTSAAGAGVWKEVTDRAAGGYFSMKDMTWNAAGIIGAVALLQRTR